MTKKLTLTLAEAKWAIANAMNEKGNCITFVAQDIEIIADDECEQPETECSQ